jgi:hypothetical protein
MHSSESIHSEVNNNVNVHTTENTAVNFTQKYTLLMNKETP